MKILPRGWNGFAAGLLTTAPAWAESGLSARLETIRKEHHLPALACAVIRSNAVVDRAAVGVRIQGDATAVSLDDTWHLGSITKSMTATLTAILVEDGTLRWSDRLGDAFPSESATLDPGWKNVTLEQLLGHRGGAPDQAWLDQTGLWKRFWRSPGTPREQRRYLVHEMLRRPPPVPPGTRHLYSNAGYILAGAWLEERTGVAWETLIQDRLFRPLGMTTAGFGPPDSERQKTGPWGHEKAGADWKAVPPGPQADNPPGLGPAGTVHASLGDLSTYVLAHLNGEWGRPTRLPLRPESWRHLHTALAGQEYALGWGITSREWAGGTAWNHTGSNTYWFCNVWVAPKRDFAVLVFTNAGGDAAFRATDAVASSVIQSTLTPPR